MQHQDSPLWGGQGRHTHLKGPLESVRGNRSVDRSYFAGDTQRAHYLHPPPGRRKCRKISRFIFLVPPPLLYVLLQSIPHLSLLSFPFSKSHKTRGEMARNYLGNMVLPPPPPQKPLTLDYYRSNNNMLGSSLSYGRESPPLLLLMQIRTIFVPINTKVSLSVEEASIEKCFSVYWVVYTHVWPCVYSFNPRQHRPLRTISSSSCWKETMSVQLAVLRHWV